MAFMYELITQSAFLNSDLVEKIRKVEAVRGEKIFKYPASLFYFISEDEGKNIQVIQSSQAYHQLIQHHIIGVDNLSSMWEVFKTFLSCIDNGNIVLNDQNFKLRESIRSFDIYIKEVSGYSQYSNQDNIAQEMWEMIIWNPGNLFLGPPSEMRESNDPAKDNYYLKGNKDEIDDIAKQVFDSSFDNKVIRKCDLLPLMNYQLASKEKDRITYLRNALHSLEYLKSFKTKQAIENNLTEVADNLTLFWKSWTQLSKSGYLVFLWVNVQRTHRPQYYPKYYAFSLSCNEIENEQNKINFLQKKTF